MVNIINLIGQCGLVKFLVSPTLFLSWNMLWGKFGFWKRVSKGPISPFFWIWGNKSVKAALGD